MKPSNFIINSRYATLAEIGSATASLTIPANFTASGVMETEIYTPYPNALFRYTITGGDKDMTMDGTNTITRSYNGLNVVYPVSVYRKDARHVALACMATDGRIVTGSSANTLTAKIHFFESPFEA